MNSTESILDLLEGYQRSQILFVAVKLGIIPALEEGLQTPESISLKLGISARGSKLLLHGLEALKLVKALRTPNNQFKFTPTRVAIQYLGKKGSINNLVLHHSVLYSVWKDLPTALRDDRSVLPNTHDIDVDAYEKGLCEYANFMNERIYKVVNFKTKRKLLDVGGGAGHHSIMAAKENPMLQCVIFDRPEVTRITSRFIHDQGLDKRLSTFEGDLLKSEWPTGFDIVLISNVLHGKGQQETVEIVSRAWKSLIKGGTIVINEWIRGIHPTSSLFDINMFLCTREGHVWSRDELSKIVRMTGFTRLKWRRIGRANAILTAHK